MPSWLRVFPDGDVEVGLCPHCLLPSVIQGQFVAESGDTGEPIGVLHLRFCNDCGCSFELEREDA